MTKRVGTGGSHDKLSDDYWVRLVALLAVAATAAAMTSHSPSTERFVVAGIPAVVDINKLPTEEYDDQSLVYSSKR